MSLSTLTQRHPLVCRIPPRNQFYTPASTHESSHPHTISWPHVLRASQIAAAATALSQFVTTPVDVLSRAIRPPHLGAYPQTLRSIVGHLLSSPLSLLAPLPLHLVKRVPAKALTVAFFELGTQLLTRSSAPAPFASTDRRPAPALTPPQHVVVATASGALALLATYPLHLMYYSVRKGVSFKTILQHARMQPRLLYSGVLPALLATAPAVIADYAVYRSLRATIDHHGRVGTRQRVGTAALIILAATASNLVGGFISEPLKTVSRKMAVTAVQSPAACGGFRMTASSLIAQGVGELWRGFPVRSVRYAISAVVSKSTVQQLKSRQWENGSASSQKAAFVIGPERVGKRHGAAHLISSGMLSKRSSSDIMTLKS